MQIHLLQGLFQIFKTRFLKYNLSLDFNAGVCPAIVYLQNHFQRLVRVLYSIQRSSRDQFSTHPETNFIFQVHSLPLFWSNFMCQEGWKRKLHISLLLLSVKRKTYFNTLKILYINVLILNNVLIPIMFYKCYTSVSKLPHSTFRF